ncbi:Ankyrin repeat and LEM domain-containing protein 2 [Holothuria leucospilota]|uniref:Ankyrin repeat and LEM domain-containing protein 2 n=1 Tax=Holothuria leucospilota TaxID=206669 RepID=A0A9Q1BLG0_HOLLE|nr:Ankyrin repeat and LEM domain-containing protein 2 [Holothuria leucospilota]
MEEIKNEVANLDDSKLRKELQEAKIPIGPIVKSTRSIFEKKLVEFKLKEKGLWKNPEEENSDVIKQKSCEGNSPVGSPKGEGNEVPPVGEFPASLTSTPKRTPSDSYYVVCIPVAECSKEDSDFVTPSKAVSHLFEDQKEALKLLKKNPGARFKVFRSQKEAESFAGLRENLSTPRSVEVGNNGESSSGTKPADSPNEFRSPKFQQYVALRKAIIGQDKDKFNELVWGNPRYLISTGDTPTILQEGSRYNAVHITSQKDLPDMCKLVLDTLQNPDFIQLMYPGENEEVVAQRISHMVDLYINVPDKGNFETPLHFACKFGNLKMVEFLLSYGVCEKNLKNRYGQTPAEVVCSRSKVSGSEMEDLKKKILELLEPSDEEEYYIPVFRSEDNTSPPHIGQPWSPASSDSQSGQSFDATRSPVDIDWTVKAFAGPMSPKEATSMYHKWTGRKKEFMDVQRSDDEKGLERIGRRLSQSAGVPWKEYWDFLDEFVNLASQEGLQKLEKYLSEKLEEAEDCPPDKIPQADEIVKNLEVEFDDMNIHDAITTSQSKCSNKGAQESDNLNVESKIFSNCGKNKVKEQSCYSVNDVILEKHRTEILRKTENSVTLDKSFDLDDLCDTFSHLRLSDSSSASESLINELASTIPGSGDHSLSKGISVKSNSSGSLSSTTENTSQSTEGSVFLSPEESVSSNPGTAESLILSPETKGVFIIGTSATRTDMDVYRAIQHMSISDDFPNVRKWKKQIESVADDLRSKWPTPLRKLRRSTSNPTLPCTPLVRDNRIFRFSPSQTRNLSLSPFRFNRPSSEPQPGSPQGLNMAAFPSTRLFFE